MASGRLASLLLLQVRLACRWSMPVNDPQTSTGDVSGIFTASFLVTGGFLIPQPLGATWRSPENIRKSPHAHLELTQLPGLSRDFGHEFEPSSFRLPILSILGEAQMTSPPPSGAPSARLPHVLRPLSASGGLKSWKEQRHVG